MKKAISALIIKLLITVSVFSKNEPNILFILADDLGYSDTTPYGNEYHETPNIARIANKGMTFDNFHTTSPVCSPSRASILTGLYAERLGMVQPACHIQQVILEPYVRDREWPDMKLKTPISTTRLDTSFPTYAKALKEAGYLTAHYGKWHLGHEPYTPLQHGFDIDVPHTESHGPKVTYFGPTKYSESFTLREGEHLEDRMATEAVQFIHENKDKPFLLNYWSFSVHSPYYAKMEILNKYREKAKNLPADAKHKNPMHAAMIETFDTNVGRLLDALEEAGIADNTIIIFSSDNGGTIHSSYTEEKHWGNGTIDEMVRMDITSNYPLKEGKGSIYDGGTAVPFMIVWPQKIKPGSRSDVLFSGADIFPTLVDMVGVSMPANTEIDGVSQVPAIQGEELVRDTLYGFWPNYIASTGAIPAAWIRHGDYKLTRFFYAAPDGSHLHHLHNVKKDKGETTNIAEKYPEKVQEMIRLMDQHFTDTGAVLPVPNPAYDPTFVRSAK
jgi:arylsulfatase A-like enzyme